MAYESMLTTTDNPYDPFEQFDPWFLFDVEHGYDSCSKIARILEKNGVSLYEGLSDKEIDAATDQAIDEIVLYDPLDVFKKVTREVQDKQ